MYVEDNLRLQHTLEEAKAEMDAAAKTARERASGKAGQTAKKTKLQGGQQTDSTVTEAPADQENPPLLPAADNSSGTIRPEQSDLLHTEHGEVRADVDTTPSGDAEGRANPRARISAS